MTESVLKSIMRLFAIIGNLKESYELQQEENHFNLTREIADSFLAQLINPDQSVKYLQIFDFHYHNLRRRRIVKTIKRAALFSVKTLLICEQINNHLDKNKNHLYCFNYWIF